MLSVCFVLIVGSGQTSRNPGCGTLPPALSVSSEAIVLREDSPTVSVTVTLANTSTPAWSATTDDLRVTVTPASSTEGTTVVEIRALEFIENYTSQVTFTEDAADDNSVGVTVSVQGSPWTNTFGGSASDGAFAVKQTMDGGFVFVGTTDSFGAGGMDVYLVKTNAFLEEQWSTTYGGETDDRGSYVCLTQDGGYAVVGSTRATGPGPGDVYFLKTDADGNELWSRTYGADGDQSGWYIQQTSDDGYIIAGRADSLTADDVDFHLVKTDAEGNQTWARTFGGPEDDTLGSCDQTMDGGFVLVGSFFAATYISLVRTDASGNVLWSKTYGDGDEIAYGFGVSKTSDGGFVVSGGATPWGMVILKTDANGDLLWARNPTEEALAPLVRVKQTIDGGYVLAGWTYEATTLTDRENVYLVRTDDDGNVLWERIFGGMDTDMALDMHQLTDGGYVIVGMTSSFGAGDTDAYILRTDMNGNAPSLSGK
jgi:hypothetical protein